MRNLVLSLALALTSVSAHAIPLTFDISGNITSVSDNSSLLDGSIVVGGTFSGVFTYDSSLPDTISDPSVYSSGGGRSSITSTLTVGNYVFQSNSGGVDLFLHDQSTDTLFFMFPYVSNPFIDLGSNSGRLNAIRFTADSGTAFPDDSLPTSLDLNDFSSAVIDLFGDNGPDNPSFSVLGDITSLRSVSLPEPGTLGLLGFGLLGSVWLRRRSLAIRHSPDRVGWIW